MKHKLKKWHIALMSFLTLFIAVFASLFSLRADTVDDETGEVLTDNWELGLVFYDSTVDNGTTPLTEINWDASDGGSDRGTPRIITVQINYKNNSAVTTYQPGEVSIMIDSLLKGADVTDGSAWHHLWQTITVGANDDTHTGYDWNYTYTNDTDNQYTGSNWINWQIGTFIFTNANIIEENSNFEGSIQIVYSITPCECKGSYGTCPSDSKYKDEHTYNFSNTLQATLSISKIITSPNWPESYPNYLTTEPIVFNYTRTYIHPWERISFTLDKTASKISSFDGLGENTSNYHWVKYIFKVSDGRYNASQSYPYIYLNKLKITDMFPEECCVYDSSLTRLYSDNNEYNLEIEYDNYIGNTHGARYEITLFVGYPKEIYNEELNNLEITNTADLYVEYLDDLGSYTYQDTDDITINLANFKFEYTGELYGVYKEEDPNEATSYYEGIIGTDSNLNSTFSFYIDPLAVHTGNTMDVKIGDDLLYITNSDGTYRKLIDDEYYFSYIKFPYALLNGHGFKISDKYDIELWIKTKDNPEYTLHSSFKNNSSNSGGDYKEFNFNQTKHVTGFYFVIKDLEESIINKYRLDIGKSYGRNYKIKCSVKINSSENILKKGNIYNFSYIQIFENGILKNEPNLDSYANFITQQEIATFDKSTYGTYMQRSCALSDYKEYTVPVPKHSLKLSKSLGSITQDAENECFSGTTTITINLKNEIESISPHIMQVYSEKIPNTSKIIGFELYDLLPKGMTLTSNPQDIINSFYTAYEARNSSTKWCGIYADSKCLSKADLYNLIRNNSTVTIINNYNDTGRTLLSIKCIFEETPLIFLSKSYSLSDMKFQYNYEISYDSLLEYGSVWSNRVYFKAYNREIGTSSTGPIYSWYTDNAIVDRGLKDLEEADIDNNEDFDEKVVYASASATITSVTSTHQDVTTYVKTDQNNYSTGTVDTSCNSEYEYKLRVRTGAADVTNLILYTNIEEAQPERTRWKGEFLDINTSYAENKGYIVNSYYSENPNAGNLYNKDGTLNSDWKEYVPDTPEIVANGLAITFDENFKTYNSSDYLYIYYYYNGQLYISNKYYNTNLAGQTIEIPATDFYLLWYTNSSGNSAYGFKISNIEPKVVTTTLENTTSSLTNIDCTRINLEGNDYPETTHNPYDNDSKILWKYTYTGNLVLEKRIEHTDKTKVKSLAFEYLDSEGNPAIIPANNLTYVLINMKSPADESIKTLARMDCRTQWNALDEFDQPVDFITGINSNVVKVALPNSVDEDSVSSITLKFTKEIQGMDSQFENMKLDKATQQTFLIRLTSLTQNEDGSYNQVTALLRNDQELIISQIPIGTYLLEELGDNYFDFIEFTNNNDPEIIIEGVTLEKTLIGYILTVSEDLSETVEFNIKVTNEIEDEKFYEDKDNKENLFLKNKIEEDSV